MKVFLGFDAREPEACRVAAKTLKQTSGIEPEWLNVDRLRDVGLLNRPTDRRGQCYDLISSAHFSTDFHVSRFMVPIICQSGWALFADADVVFIRDVREMLYEADPDKAVMVVQHDHQPSNPWKMESRRQTNYTRKNWSSVMLFNVDHAANKRLTVHDVNTRKGLDLHNLYWLHDREIGELRPCWNWLVNETEMPENPGIAHFTNGGPFTARWKGAKHDDIWLEAAQ